MNFRYVSDDKKSTLSTNCGMIKAFTDKAPIGESDKFSTVARNSSTDAEMGAVPLFSGLIST